MSQLILRSRLERFAWRQKTRSRRRLAPSPWISCVRERWCGPGMRPAGGSRPPFYWWSIGLPLAVSTFFESFYRMDGLSRPLRGTRRPMVATSAISKRVTCWTAVVLLVSSQSHTSATHGICFPAARTVTIGQTVSFWEARLPLVEAKRRVSRRTWESCQSGVIARGGHHSNTRATGRRHIKRARARFSRAGALSRQAAHSTIATTSRTPTLPNGWPVWADCPPSPEDVVMADEPTEPRWNLDSYDSERMPPPQQRLDHGQSLSRFAAAWQ
jgi:hypothetical protein